MVKRMKRFLFLVRKSIMPLMIAGLLISNGMTLFNSAVHDALFAALSRVVPQNWRKNSPSARLEVKKIRLKSVRSTVKKVTKRVARRTARNVTANLASIPAEAIPFMGIPVILAITAMDLTDACNDLKDMDELRASFSLQDVEDTDKVCGLRVPSKKEILG